MGRIRLRSRAWHGDQEVELSVPEAWRVEVLAPADGPELSEALLRQALAEPSAGPRLAERARGRTSALILVDDLGRPTPAHRIVPHLLQLLSEAGVPRSGVSFLVATGSHRQLTRAEIALKLGPEVAAEYPVHCHDAFGTDLADLGRLPSGMPVIVNRRVAEAELVIGVSCVLPHALAGFSGGGKILLPGCAGILSIAELHSFEAKRPRGCPEPVRRRPDAREVIEAFAARVGLGFSVNVVVNAQRQVTAAFAGDPVEAHRQAVARARQVYRTPIPQDLRRGVDLVIANGYPLDADPVQVSKSQWPLRVFPGARAILYDPACDGTAYHGWSEFQKASLLTMVCGAIGEGKTDGRYPGPLGALLARPAVREWAHRRLRAAVPRDDLSYGAYLEERGTIRTNTPAKRVMARRAPLVICSAGFPEWKRRLQFPNAQLYPDWEGVRAAGHLPEAPLRVAVLPCAPLQLPDADPHPGGQSAG